MAAKKKQSIKKQISAARNKVSKTGLAQSKKDIQAMLTMGDATVRKAQKAVKKKIQKKK